MEFQARNNILFIRFDPNIKPMSEFLTFRKFDNAAEAIAISELLQEKNIPTQLEETPMILDQQLMGQHFDNTFLLKIPASQFITADNILRAAVKVEDVEDDYYLLSFSDKELQEIIEKKDEWGSYDYALALQLLEKRGIPYSPAQLVDIDQQRKETLIVPQKGSILWITIGYLSPLINGFPGFFWGSFLGIFIGGFLWRTKKTLPDGTRIFAYNANTRKHGRVILIISCIVLPLWIWYLMSGNEPPSFYHIFAFFS